MSEDRIIAAAKAWVGILDDTVWDRLDESLRKSLIVRTMAAVDELRAPEDDFPHPKGLYLELWQLLGWTPGAFEAALERLGWEGCWNEILAALSKTKDRADRLQETSIDAANDLESIAAALSRATDR